MDYHICKNRRGSNPDTMVKCSNTSCPGSLSQGTRTQSGPCQGCSKPLNLQICPTTGGLFHIDIPATETVQGLRKLVSKKLGLPQDRISLLHKERLLKEGTLLGNHIANGSRITLLPNVESGIMSCPPELSVMQALENLSEKQVDEFLTGRSPLTLAMRLGNHMMFLQLQLSTVAPGVNRTQSRSPVPSSSTSKPLQHQTPQRNPSVTLTPPPRIATKPTNAPRVIKKNNQLSVPTIAPALVMTPPPSPKSPTSATSSSPSPYTYPVTSLAVPPIGLSTPAREMTLDPTNTPPPSPSYQHKVAGSIPTVQVNDKPLPAGGLADQAAGNIRNSVNNVTMASSTQTTTNPRQGNGCGLPFLNGSTLAEAKRNLSKKLKEFSERASTEKAAERTQAGAVIETMKKLANGVFSGTFSGTLNPALQDGEGKPKKNVSTIVHILNDLLGASRPPTYTHRMTTSQHRDGNNSHKSGEPQNGESEAIRGKVEHLQMMMEERRHRRQARRRHRAAPYPQHHVASSTSSRDVGTGDDSHDSDQHEDQMDIDVGLV